MEDHQFYDKLTNRESDTYRIIKEIIRRANYYDYINVSENEDLELTANGTRVPSIKVYSNNRDVELFFKSGKSFKLLLTEEQCLLIRRIVAIRRSLSYFNLELFIGERK